MRQNPYSIVFLGSNINVLSYLIRDNRVKISHAFFHKKSGPSANFIHTCRKFDLAYSIVDDNRQILQKLNGIEKADMGICAGFEVIPDKIFTWPRRGFINIHPSYLPYYKGANPFFYMFLNDEKTGGVSIHKITRNIDGGRILARAKYPICDSDDIAALIFKTDSLAKKLLGKYLVKIICGDKKGISNKGGSYYPPVKSRQVIDTAFPIRKIFNLVRSQTIYGGCYIIVKKRKLLAVKVEIIPKDAEIPKSRSKSYVILETKEPFNLMLEVKKGN